MPFRGRNGGVPLQKLKEKEKENRNDLDILPSHDKNCQGGSQ